jgi:excisionase family DNA binding protein
MPKKIPPKPVALSVRDAASFLSVSRSRIYELINAGELLAYKGGARTLILTASCEEWLERLKPFPASPPPTSPLLPSEDRKLARRRARDPETDATGPLLPAGQRQIAIERAIEPEPPPPIDPQQFGEPLAPALDAQQRSSVEPASDLAALYLAPTPTPTPTPTPNPATSPYDQARIDKWIRDRLVVE